MECLQSARAERLALRSLSNVNKKEIKMGTSNRPILTLHVNENGVGTVVIDLQGERLNLLKRQALEELEEIIAKAESNSGPSALVFISGKEDNFLAGADISMFAEFKTIEDGY